jgi:hypothetical protein
MRSLESAEALYLGLRERDRTVASLLSKQRMVGLFDHLFDDSARETVQTRLRRATEELRSQARALALELGRAALLELEIDDLPRIAELERRLAAHLDDHPTERLECCGDLVTFIKELRELRHPPRPRAPDGDFDAF